MIGTFVLLGLLVLVAILAAVMTFKWYAADETARAGWNKAWAVSKELGEVRAERDRLVQRNKFLTNQLRGSDPLADTMCWPSAKPAPVQWQPEAHQDTGTPAAGKGATR